LGILPENSAGKHKAVLYSCSIKNMVFADPRKHGDLINTSLMRRHIESGDPAVIGLLRYTSKAEGLSKELR